MLHKTSRVEFHPLGVVGAIVSWNYPFHNLFNPVLAAVFSGNGIVVKVCSIRIQIFTLNRETCEFFLKFNYLIGFCRYLNTQAGQDVFMCEFFKLPLQLLEHLKILLK